MANLGQLHASRPVSGLAAREYIPAAGPRQGRRRHVRFRLIALLFVAALVLAGLPRGPRQPRLSLPGTSALASRSRSRAQARRLRPSSTGSTRSKLATRRHPQLHAQWPGAEEYDDHCDGLRRHEDSDVDAQEGRIQVLLHRAPQYHRDVQSQLKHQRGSSGEAESLGGVEAEPAELRTRVDADPVA